MCLPFGGSDTGVWGTRSRRNGFGAGRPIGHDSHDGTRCLLFEKFQMQQKSDQSKLQTKLS